MDTDFGTIVIFFFLIFGVLETTGVIIPAMLRRSKAKKRYEPEYYIPPVLSQPVPADHVARMRSWYFDQNDTHRYIRSVALDPGTPANAGYRRQVLPVSPGGQHLQHPEPEKDWKAVNKATWAIQRANKAIREANFAIREANTAIQQAGADDLEWMDEIAEMNQLRLPPVR